MNAKTSFSTVIIVHDYGDIRGGQEKVAVDSALGLRAAGVDVVYFCACAPVDPRLAAQGVRVICLDQHDIASHPSALGAARQGLWNPIAARRLGALLAEFAPGEAVVHVHGWTKALSAAIGPVVTAPGQKHVYTMHEYFLACPNGGFFNYPKGEVCTLRAMGPACMVSHCDQRHIAHKAFRVARSAAAQIRGKLPKGLRNIIYISELQRSVMEAYLPREARLHAVGNPISVAKAPRIAAEENAPFVFVGRLEPVKGALDFARAAAEAGLPAVLVGDGAEREAVRAANGAAEVTGWVPPEEVMARLRSARCLVFPSHWYECQPLVPYEALALGIPVITYDASAAREAVVDGRNGQVVSFDRRATALPEAMARCADPAYVQAQSEAAHGGYWSAPLTRERHVSALLGVYGALA
ncbi:MAG: glycosyltransferase family 4 protein [Pseudomonadota bacterium]